MNLGEKYTGALYTIHTTSWVTLNLFQNKMFAKKRRDIRICIKISETDTSKLKDVNQQRGEDEEKEAFFPQRS